MSRQRLDPGSRGRYASDRFGVLLVALLVFILAVPAGTRGPYGVITLQFSIATVAVASAWSVGVFRHRWAVVGVLVLVALNASTLVTRNRAHLTLALAALTGFVAWVTWTVTARLARRRRVTTDTLWGAAVAYLLAGFAFAFTYAVIGLMSPGALRGILDDPITNAFTAPDRASEFPRILHFSLVTQSGLGYGGATPDNDLLRMLGPLQAILGQLYLAILVARMVALHLLADSRALGEGRE